MILGGCLEVSARSGMLELICNGQSCIKCMFEPLVVRPWRIPVAPSFVVWFTGRNNKPAINHVRCHNEIVFEGLSAFALLCYVIFPHHIPPSYYNNFFRGPFSRD